MTALLSVLVQLASVAAGLYLGLHGSILLGIGVFAAVQILHWLSEKLMHLILGAHEQHFLSKAERDLVGLQFAPGLVGYTPAAWRRIAIAVGLTYVGISCFVIWLALSR